MARRDIVGFLDWPHDGTKADREVLGAIRFVQLRFLAWSLNLVFLPFLLFILWGTRSVVGATFFSLGATTYALHVGIRGWKPWRMATYRAFSDGDSDRWNRNVTAVAVAEFLRAPRIRWAAAVIIGTSALTPWVILLTARLINAVPVSLRDGAFAPRPIMALLGYADGVRGGTLAALWMLRELRHGWDAVREGHRSEPTL